jgi:L-lactate utilization protein LutC
MITTAITVGSDGTVVLGSGATYGILVAILVFHGIVCSAATRIVARLNLAYVVMNGEQPPSPLPNNASLLNFTQLGRPSLLSSS